MNKLDLAVLQFLILRNWSQLELKVYSRRFISSLGSPRQHVAAADDVGVVDELARASYWREGWRGGYRRWHWIQLQRLMKTSVIQVNEAVNKQRELTTTGCIVFNISFDTVLIPKSQEEVRNLLLLRQRSRRLAMPHH